MAFPIRFSQAHPCGVPIDYGILPGNQRLVFIKSGRGGTLTGREDKYERMAQCLRESFGCTVICASNPIECDVSYSQDQAVIEQYAAEHRLERYDLSLIGSSNGAYQILFLAERLPVTRELLCINMPLMLNFHKAVRVLQELARVEKTFVYGTRDPSYSYVPFLEMKQLQGLRILRLTGVDHEFTDRIEDFVGLTELLRLS